MLNLSKSKINNTNFLNIIILATFSFFINLYYSSLGSFPIDTFLHYDSSSRILNGELPSRDFWVVSGLTVDFIQAFFFKIFGVNWYAYTIHSSLFNCLISLIVYFYFVELKIKKLNALLFSLSFGTLSYTISGTPFVDLHATFLLLISTLLIIKYLNSENNFIWFLIIALLFLSFFSKQVPTAYAVIIYPLILIPYFIYKKKYNRILISTAIILAFFVLIYFLLQILNIDQNFFYIQYVDYPRSIGSTRLGNLEINLFSFINKFKFIILPFLLLIFINFKQKKSLENRIGFFLLSSFILVIIFHQLMTKNQTYIYFLVPILFGLLDSEIHLTQIKFKKYVSIFLILTLAFITLKYHLRFNENRKFHELTKTELLDAVNAEKIHKTLKGLNWKNPHYKGQTSEEIIILNRAHKELSKKNYENAMLITHYQFLDSIIKKKLYYPSRTFTTDGTSMPMPQNKYFNLYKKFFLNKIYQSNTDKIIFFKHENISRKVFTNYISKNCYKIFESDIFEIYKLSCLK